MSSILKWLHKNEGLVHMCVMLVVFYGIPTIALSILYPNLVEPLLNSAIGGVTLVVLLYVSYKAATIVTELIKNAVASAALDQIRDITLQAAVSVKDPTVDYTSSNVLVVNNVSDETKEAVASLKTVAETAVVSVNSAPAAKKRPGRPKSVKKGG